MTSQSVSTLAGEQLCFRLISPNNLKTPDDSFIEWFFDIVTLLAREYLNHALDSKGGVHYRLPMQ